MMRTLLQLGAVGFSMAALLDPLWVSGLGRPIAWQRDLLLAIGGILCFYALVRFRDLL
ncbi:hypothetical protein SAMN05660860_01092 [Geoalkalibacter ferrihydriticus]|uniref:Uncharacterized protein n=1 Tax=Geoalkalibacter ferrihydriticus TaxID=392333 RepID=A0A1G9MAS5_9BACT|nr:hypothetical protein [Geoalkalibacter ferrihydriticus]SDL71366.1 hypothetical protein SAMN05660860_01092 [Geoalkalibacter ferrihydriticus]